MVVRMIKYPPYYVRWDAVIKDRPSWAIGEFNHELLEIIKEILEKAQNSFCAVETIEVDIYRSIGEDVKVTAKGVDGYPLIEAIHKQAWHKDKVSKVDEHEKTD